MSDAETTGSAPDPDEADPEPGEPAAPADAQLADLREDLEEARAEAQEHLDKRKRTQADFRNYRRRKEQELDASRRRARDDLLTDLLPLVDSFERALEGEVGSGAEEREGMEMLRKQLASVLQAEGVERMDAEGAGFDPHRHEAVLREPTDEAAPGTVLQVLEAGFVRDGEVLRPAKVQVAEAPADGDDADDPGPQR